jgi:outer membrane protein assembly factor BamB
VGKAIVGVIFAVALLSIGGTAKPQTARHAGKPATSKGKAVTPVANDRQWLEFGHDDQSTKQVVSRAITSKNVGRLRQRWSVSLDGVLVAEPLYFDGMVYAASEGGDIVAIDARSGTPVWKQTTPISKELYPDCGNWGVSATPVIDPATNRIYVAAADGLLYAYDLDGGTVEPGFPFSVVDDPSIGYVWGALRLLGPNILVGISSHCDEPNDAGEFVTGGLAAYDVARNVGRQTAFFQTVPVAQHLGGVWGFSGATVTTSGRSVFTGVGNAAGTDPDCSCDHEDWGYGDSLVRLSSSLDVSASNDPGIPANGADDDWGAAPVLFTPKGCSPLAAAANKDGYIYVYKQNALGAGPIWKLGVGVGEPPLLDSPAWSPSTRMFYAAGARMPYDRRKAQTGAGIVAVKVSTRCKFSVAWTAQTGDGSGDYGAQPPPIVVGDVVFASGGSSDVLALNAKTGKQLWVADTLGNTLASPSEAAGTLFTADGNNVVAWSP